MITIYTDDSGSFHYNDKTKYFVLSGVVVEDDKIKQLKTASYKYKLKNFIDEYVDSEIHTHDIFKAKGDFTSLKIQQSNKLLYDLYTTISKLDITTISIIIDKQLLKVKYPSPKTNISLLCLESAWLFLLERFDKILEEKSKDAWGTIKIDNSTSKFNKIISNLLKKLQEEGTKYQRKVHINHPIFVNSAAVEGIQIADAIAYCSFMYKHNHYPFVDYWDLIYPKFRTNKQGTPHGYGLKVFP